MSVLALARQRVAELSQWDKTKGRPSGTVWKDGTAGTAGTPETADNATAIRSGSCPAGPSLSTVPVGQSSYSTAGRIHATSCPDGFAPSRWRPIQEGAAHFAEEWGACALALGWSEAELFALVEPFARIDLQGAAWFIGADKVTAVTADAITLRTVTGAALRIYRSRK